MIQPVLVAVIKPGVLTHQNSARCHSAAAAAATAYM
jgi:hypothetical protein